MSSRSEADGRSESWDALDAALAGLLRDDPAGEGLPDAPVSPAPMTRTAMAPSTTPGEAATKVARRPGPGVRRRPIQPIVPIDGDAVTLSLPSLITDLAAKLRADSDGPIRSKIPDLGAVAGADAGGPIVSKIADLGVQVPAETTSWPAAMIADLGVGARVDGSNPTLSKIADLGMQAQTEPTNSPFAKIADLGTQAQTESTSPPLSKITGLGEQAAPTTHTDSLIADLGTRPPSDAPTVPMTFSPTPEPRPAEITDLGERRLLDDATAEEIDEAAADVIRRAGYAAPEIDPAAPRRGVASWRPGLGRHHASGRIRTEWEARYMRALAAVDLLAALGAGVLAFTVRFGNEVTAYNQGYLVLTGLLPLVMICTLVVNRAYERRFLFVGTDEYQRVLRAGLTMTAMTAVMSYAFDVGLARGYVVLALPSATLASIIGRFMLRKHLHARRARGKCLRRVIVVGHELAVVGVAHQLGRELYHGLEVVGCCLPPKHDGNVGLPVYGTFDDVAVAVQAARADTVIVLSCPELDGQMLRRLAWRLEREDIDLIVASTLVDVAGARTTIRPVDGLPMLHIEHPRLSGASRVVKSAFDRVGGVLGLILLAPLLLGLALWIKKDSAGPVLFRQIRVGKGGREFVIFKFRTMSTDAEARLAALKTNQDGSVLFKMRDDPRITRVGRMLRRLSLDELPQLLNVVLGDMSLVGPRPPLPEEVAAYPSDMRRRLAVSPGMTGLWQVSGRSDLSWEETVRLDLRYVENWSFSLDLVILLRTLSAVCRSSGAY